MVTRDRREPYQGVRTMGIECQKCGATNRDGAWFCNDCGASLTAPVTVRETVTLPPAMRHCPQCHAVNAATAEFCKICGFGLAAPGLPAAAVTPQPFDPDATMVFSGVADDAVALPHGHVVVDFDLDQPAVQPPQAVPARNPLSVEPAAKDGSAIAKWLLIGAALLAMVLGAGAWFWHQRTAAPGTLPAPSGPVLPVVPVPVVPMAPAVTPVTSPMEPVAAPQMPVAPAAPASLPAPVPTPAPLEVPAIVAPAPAAIKPVPKASVAKPVKPAIRPDPAAKSPSAAPEHGQSSDPRPVPPQAVRPPPAAPLSPREACGNRVFLALSFCMHEQCSSSQFQNHPQCVEMRRQQKEAEEQRERHRP
jgi:ribosomal protein L40E